MKMKPSLPSGTRDFLPQEVAKRNYIFSVIRSVFEKYGFQQIETPVLENLATLTGKYGDEGDQLLFKVLNSGDYLKDADPETLQNKDSKKLTAKIADRGLRYDLTVPLARYVVQHQNDLVFPFKRYHIAPVWRADRPQKGRYREFYQCDADVIGSNSLLNEVELTQIFDEAYTKLNLQTEIRINHRKILEAIALSANCHDQLTNLTVAIDKFDKVGLAGVAKELTERNFSIEQVEKINTLLQITSLDELKKELGGIEAGQQGIEELEYVIAQTKSEKVVFDITLARGLNYYTGIIWEIKSKDSNIGSMGSGGRYGNLTEMFGGRDMSGVGISFGIERIYDVMEELNLFPKSIGTTTKVLFVHFDETDKEYSFPLVQQLRAKNIASEIYPDKAKMEKQMKYANAKAIPFVVVVGENERKSGQLSVKNMASGEQQSMTFENLISFLTQ